MITQLIASEEFTNIQEAQAGLARLFNKAEVKGNFYRVLRNNKPMGVLVPNRIWESFIEDIQALSSPDYLRMIEKSRADKKRYSAAEVKKKLKIT